MVLQYAVSLPARTHRRATASEVEPRLRNLSITGPALYQLIVRLFSHPSPRLNYLPNINLTYEFKF